MYFYVYYIKESHFTHAKLITRFHKLSGWLQSDIFTCEITINNFTCAIISFSVPEIPIKHYTLYKKLINYMAEINGVR